MVATRIEMPAHQPSEQFSIMPIRHRKKKMCPELKVIVLGNAGVGKTSLVAAMTSNSLEKSVGVDYRVKMASVNDEIVKLQLWDTADQEKHGAAMLSKAYYRRARGVFLVYNTSDRQSFDDVAQWATQLHANRDASEPLSMVLVSNQSKDPSVVSSFQGRALATLLDATFVENEDWTNAMVCLKELVASLAREKPWQPVLENLSMHLKTVEALVRVEKSEPMDEIDSTTESESDASDDETEGRAIEPSVFKCVGRRDSKFFAVLELGEATSVTAVNWISSRDLQRVALVSGCTLLCVCLVLLMLCPMQSTSLLDGVIGWLRHLAIAVAVLQ